MFRPFLFGAPGMALFRFTVGEKSNTFKTRYLYGNCGRICGGHKCEGHVHYPGRSDDLPLAIEGVLKQAVLKRGLPVKLVVDNGPAYRAKTLQGICARLGIHLIYCRPYAPEGKGKLERWHRTVRDQFLSELDATRIQDLSDLRPPPDAAPPRRLSQTLCQPSIFK